MRPAKKMIVLLGVFLLLLGMVSSAGADSVTGLFSTSGPTVLSDNSADLLLNVDGSVSANGTPTITPGDILVTVVGINTIGGTNIGAGSQNPTYNEVTAISAVKITSDPILTFTNGQGILIGLQYSAAPLTAADILWFDWSTGIIDDHNGNVYTFTPVAGTSNDGTLFALVYEDAANNYQRGGTIQASLDSATDGTLRLKLGLVSGNGDFLHATAPVDIGSFATIPAGAQMDGSSINFNGTILSQNWPPLNFNANITGGNGGFASPTPSSSWPAFDNLDFTVTAQPCIDLVKEVSSDGITWYDANSETCSDAPGTPGPAYYRLTIKNCGSEELTNLVINDSVLGITDYQVGSNLPAGGPDIILTSADIAQLNNPALCPLSPDNPNVVNGGLRNIARVDGVGVTSGIAVSDEDPACIKCACLDIEKEISIDGGAKWYDADTVADAVIAVAPHGALYRLIVTNCGFVDLTNVAVTDDTLFTGSYTIASLAAQASVTLTSGEIPQLNVPTRCETAGTFTNTACASTTFAGIQLQDCDPAVLICEGETGGCRMTGGHVAFLDDGSSLTLPYGAETYTVTTKQVKNGKKFLLQNDVTWYTLGGQIGAPQAGCLSGPDPKQPYGDWEHVHHQGTVSWDNGATSFTGGFAFHSGTASTPDEAYIKCILCADPGWCVQARCAPFKQIFWEGTGVFKNIDKGTVFPNSCKPNSFDGPHDSKWTIHYYRAHVGDFGEPAGNTEQQKPSDQCGWRSSGVSIQDGILGVAPTVLPWPLDDKFGFKLGQVCSAYPNCTQCGECPDWYEIEIHCTADPTSPVIYKVGNFITHGNHQIHPEVGQHCVSQ